LVGTLPAHDDQANLSRQKSLKRFGARAEQTAVLAIERGPGQPWIARPKRLVGIKKVPFLVCRP
jgi:hypothetical protein